MSLSQFSPKKIFLLAVKYKNRGKGKKLDSVKWKFGLISVIGAKTNLTIGTFSFKKSTSIVYVLFDSEESAPKWYFP